MSRITIQVSWSKDEERVCTIERTMLELLARPDKAVELARGSNLSLPCAAG